MSDDLLTPGRLATLRATDSPWPLSANAIRRTAGLSSPEAAKRHLRALVRAGLVRRTWARADKYLPGEYVWQATAAGRRVLAAADREANTQ
ncbi:MAG TPA: helix-turn-helix domain-containing protein [Conexibacter sp.]|nr:helix-turn-helix domain-containing protein [Conexibacter sp.]